MESHFVQKELKKGDYFCMIHKVATKIAFLQEGILRSIYTNKGGQESNKNFFVHLLLLVQSSENKKKVTELKM